jgi:putative Mg2+ transporter-C (MgtC) family protein
MSEWEGLLRLLVAAAVGGAIGFERETVDKGAGLRTYMLVSVGAATFTTLSMLIVDQFGEGASNVRVDPARIPSYIISGIGFIGGGIIFRDATRVKGVTTAAGVWVAAAIGTAAGAGYYIMAIGCTVLTLAILFALRRLQIMLDIKDQSGYRERQG